MERVSQSEFARRHGVNRSTVSRWVASGRVKVDEHGRIEDRRTEADEPAAVTETPTPPVAEAMATQGEGSRPGMSESMAMSLALRRASADERQAKAELARREVERLASTLALRSEFDHVLRHFMEMTTAALHEFPRKISLRLAEHAGDATLIHATISGAVNELLDSIAEKMSEAAVAEQRKDR